MTDSDSAARHCPTCHGTGQVRCGSCAGKGRTGGLGGPYSCVVCFGRGVQECPRCSGGGRIGDFQFEVHGTDASEVERVARALAEAGLTYSAKASTVQSPGPHGRSVEIPKDVPRADFGIVTALPLELDAVLCHCANTSKVTFEQDDTRTYYRCDLDTALGGSYQVVVTVLPRMGNVEAALATNDLIRLWHPRYVLMVGIAAGASASSQALGDVVISEHVVYYESAKIAQRVEARPRVLPADALLYDRALNFRSSNWYRALPSNVHRPDETNRVPALHFGPIASGEKVIADRDAVEYLRELQPKLAAIEMEGAGVAAAALGAVRRVGFLVIRGLCDFADAAKDDRWQAFSAHAAATFAAQLLRSAPVEPRSRAIQAQERRPPDLRPRGIDRSALFRSMNKALDLEEFKTLCFLLQIDVDDIPGDRKSSKVRELIMRFERRGRLDVVEQTFADMLKE
jgi:nucleoside phosphorylase